MSKPANKQRGEVLLPESLGKGATIRFTVDALERLESLYGEDYVETIINRTGKGNLTVFRAVLEAAAVDGVEIDINGLPSEMEATRGAIMDALFLAIHGRNVEEQLAKEEADQIAGIQKNLERMNEDPQMAAALAFLQRFGGQDISPDSAPEKSVA